MPTARAFVHELVLHHLAAEGRIWRTLRALLLHPGLLTIEYLRGRKAAYVPPLRLYLTASVVFFLTLRIAIAPGNERLIEAVHRDLNDHRTTFSIVDLGVAHAIRKPDGSLDCTFPIWFCAHIQDRILRPPGELERRLASLAPDLFDHLSEAMFLLLPIFAVLLQIAYWRRTYGEHILFALHVHSFWHLALLLTLIPGLSWMQFPVILYMGGYALTALHAVYPTAWWVTALKGAAITLAYLTSLLLVTGAIAVWSVIH
ncbi:MAG TPA: DUF3667 domain-containing protein [Caulobacteraceae bacterium]